MHSLQKGVLAVLESTLAVPESRNILVESTLAVLESRDILVESRNMLVNHASTLERSVRALLQQKKHLLCGILCAHGWFENINQPVN